MRKRPKLGAYASLLLNIAVGSLLCFLSAYIVLNVLESATGWPVDASSVFPGAAIVAVAAYYIARLVDRVAEPAPPLSAGLTRHSAQSSSTSTPFTSPPLGK